MFIRDGVIYAVGVCCCSWLVAIEDEEVDDDKVADDADDDDDDAVCCLGEVFTFEEEVTLGFVLLLVS